MQVPMCSSPSSPIFSRISPIFSPLTTFSGDFKTEQTVIEMEEMLFRLDFEIKCNKDKIDRLIDLMCVSKEDRNEETLKELDICNRLCSELYDKKLKLNEDLMCETKLAIAKKIKMVKTFYGSEDKVKMGEEETKEKEYTTNLWKDFEISNKNKTSYEEEIWENAFLIQRLPEKIDNLLQKIDCGDYLNNKGNLVKALKVFNKRFEIKQTRISKKRGYTCIHEYSKGGKRNLLLIHSEGSKRDLKYSMRKGAYWILKTFGEELEESL